MVHKTNGCSAMRPNVHLWVVGSLHRYQLLRDLAEMRWYKQLSEKPLRLFSKPMCFNANRRKDVMAFLPCQKIKLSRRRKLSTEKIYRDTQFFRVMCTVLFYVGTFKDK